MSHNLDPILRAWDWPTPPRATPLTSGLINASWRVDGDHGPLGALQRLNTRIFKPSVHEDIDAVTAHLAAKGLPTPRLVRTRAGGLWHEDDGGVWRVLTWLGSRTVDAITHPDEARSAGALVARFHGAVADLDWTFQHVRPGPHDTNRHAATLAAALDAHRDHALYDAVAPLAQALLERWSVLAPQIPNLPLRVIHGDLNISNVRFDGHDALTLIDLDTLARDTLGAELGDAMRSWCGTAGEDVAQASFDLDIFEAAMRGYASGAAAWGPTDDEWAAVVTSTERIATELAMRFAADALNESYFGWDKARFARAGDHNLLRARGQASLADAVSTARADAERRLVAARTRH